MLAAPAASLFSRRVSPRALVLAAAGLLIAATPLAIRAATPTEVPASALAQHADLVNTAEGIAIKGYDPVAYFTEGRPVLGDPAITAEHAGATWFFVTAEHRDAFLAHPTRYEPEYGGFCAYGAAHGIKTDIDPAAFSIIGGRLYLNANIDTRTVWRADLIASIAQADRNWSEVKDQPILR
jgi:YHS domain-containing protein